MVRKKDLSWWPCVDFQHLNAVTRKHSYPLPRIDVALDCIAGSSWFSSLDLDPWSCIEYLDNLLVHASQFEGALAKPRDFFKAIQWACLQLHPKKCHLFQRETAFLGHMVSAAGMSIDPVKVAAVREWPVPNNVRELRSCLPAHMLLDNSTELGAPIERVAVDILGLFPTSHLGYHYVLASMD